MTHIPQISLEEKFALLISCSYFENDHFEVKAYIANLYVTDVRLKFKIISHRVPTIKMNFQFDISYDIQAKYEHLRRKRIYFA